MLCASDCAGTEIKLYEFCNVALEENDWSVSFFWLFVCYVKIFWYPLHIWVDKSLTQSLDIVLFNMKGKLALCVLCRHWGIWRYSSMHFQPWYYVDMG